MHVNVLYGTETGNARTAALQIIRRLVLAEIPCSLSSLNEFWDRLQTESANAEERHGVAIFVVSTTRQGAAPSTMQRFWRGVLRASLSPTYFENMRYTVFGLGDSRYPQFNVCSRRLFIRLKQLGAKEFFQLGLGDEQHDFGYEGEFDPWCEKMFEALTTTFQLPAAPIHLNATALRCIMPPDYVVEQQHPNREDNASDDVQQKTMVLTPLHVPYAPSAASSKEAASAVMYGRVVSNKRMTDTTHFQDVRLIQIALPPGTNYAPGDAISVYPAVPCERVRTFISETLGLRPTDHVQVSLREGSYLSDNPFDPARWTLLEDVFSHYLDITAVPDRYFFQVLAHFAADPQQAQKLEEMGGSSLESKDAYYEYCKSECRSVDEVLWDFNSARCIPLDYLFSIIPVIRPRPYSCACSQSWYSRRLWWTLAGDIVAQSPMIWSSRAPLVAASHLSGRHRNNSMILSPMTKAVDRGTDAKPLGPLLRRWGAATVSEDPATDYVQCETVVDMCVAVVQFTTKLQRNMTGLCSTYLRDLQAGEHVLLTVQPSSSFTPQHAAALESNATPLLLVSPGTGVAPCRALVQRRFLQWLARRRCCDTPQDIPRQPSAAAPIVLAVGIRHPQKDFLFRTEWELLRRLSEWRPWPFMWQDAEALPKRPSSWWSFWVKHRSRPMTWQFAPLAAFSRLRDDVKVYVQEALEAHGDVVATLVQRSGCVVIVSGRSHPMPSQVLRALEDIIETEAKVSHDEAVRFWDTKTKRGELIFDTWG